MLLIQYLQEVNINKYVQIYLRQIFFQKKFILYNSKCNQANYAIRNSQLPLLHFVDIAIKSNALAIVSTYMIVFRSNFGIIATRMERGCMGILKLRKFKIYLDVQKIRNEK